MEPVRVLQVLASLDRGGAESMIMNIYRHIDKSKIQFDFVVNEQIDEYAFEEEIRKLGGRIYRMPSYKIANSFTYKRAWKHLLCEHPEWSVVHGHHTSPAFIYLMVAKSLNRVTIAHSHVAGGEASIRSFIKVLMRYPLRYLADYLFACSGSAAKWMFGKHSSSAYIINNSVDAKQFNFDKCNRELKRKELNIDNKFVIGHIGRFQTQKNHEFLIDIFNAVHEKYDRSVLLLIGDGELRKLIEKRVNALELTGNVIFTGVRSDIPELLQAMDIFLFPSLYEGLPVTLVEAQAAGLKIIAADTITEDIKLTDLVEFESLNQPASCWADHILRYKDGYERRNTYTSISKAGYDVKKNAKLLESLYLNMYKKAKFKL
jgi:glycosyltransferase involved in cell wall biosynthesis